VDPEGQDLNSHAGIKGPRVLRGHLCSLACSWVLGTLQVPQQEGQRGRFPLGWAREDRDDWVGWAHLSVFVGMSDHEILWFEMTLERFETPRQKAGEPSPYLLIVATAIAFI
jgi:hypothetical protein